jgi:hypothetical protein
MGPSTALDPLYPYSKFARYSGTGSQDDAANLIAVDTSR